MANHPKIGAYDLDSLRLILYGGSPTPLGILQKAVRAIPSTYIHGYGITETSGITTLAAAEDFCVEGPPERVALTASAGRAVPHIELDVVNDDGRKLAVGETPHNEILYLHQSPSSRRTLRCSKSRWSACQMSNGARR